MAYTLQELYHSICICTLPWTAGRLKSALLPHVLDKSLTSPPERVLYRRRGGRSCARTPRAPAKGCRPLHSCLVATFTSPCLDGIRTIVIRPGIISPFTSSILLIVLVWPFPFA